MNIRRIASLIGAVLLAFGPLAVAQDLPRSLPENREQAAEALRKLKGLAEEAQGVSTCRKNYLPAGPLIQNAGGAAQRRCRAGEQVKECVCESALDCVKLVRSGECEGGTWRQDADNAEVLGCDVPRRQ